MRVLLLHNPNSGRGTGEAIALDLANRLIDAGHAVQRLAAGRELNPQTFLGALCENDLLIIAGGDGTLHHALPSIIETGTPFYHFPLGTENLFTREFGMDRQPETLLRAIECGITIACDAGSCNGRPFSLMVGVGFDACVVQRLAAERTGGTSRAAYVRHSVQELLDLRVPRLTVDIDGRRVIDHEPGMIVIANSRQYAGRLDPARHADMSDGLLDVVFYPHRTSLGLARWLVATAAGMHTEMQGLITTRGSHFRVETTEAAPFQIDGEAAGLLPPGGAPGTFALDVQVLPGVLRVLAPR